MVTLWWMCSHNTSYFILPANGNWLALWDFIRSAKGKGRKNNFHHRKISTSCLLRTNEIFRRPFVCESVDIFSTGLIFDENTSSDERSWYMDMKSNQVDFHEKWFSKNFPQRKNKFDSCENFTGKFTDFFLSLSE